MGSKACTHSRVMMTAEYDQDFVHKPQSHAPFSYTGGYSLPWPDKRCVSVEIRVCVGMEPSASSAEGGAPVAKLSRPWRERREPSTNTRSGMERSAKSTPSSGGGVSADEGTGLQEAGVVGLSPGGPAQERTISFPRRSTRLCRPLHHGVSNHPNELCKRGPYGLDDSSSGDSSSSPIFSSSSITGDGRLSA
jgi:hypothetical protein